MEKRNVIEEKRTPGFSKQADADTQEKQITKLFKEHKDVADKDMHKVRK